MKPLRIALVADTLPPFRTSGAVQLRDLSREFANQGHSITVILPSSDIKENWQSELHDKVQVLRLKSPKTKDINYIRRTINEFRMPFEMRKNYNRSSFSNTKWDGVVWYSPSIFHGPFVRSLKKVSSCKSYLIIRDIFPDWAVDMGLMSKGLPYLFFKSIANYQYKVADVIGVQTPGNLGYFDLWRLKYDKKVEVLQNWLADPANNESSIQVNKTRLSGRSICIYAGNMGIAQGMKILIELACKLQSEKKLGFLFVGRGSEVDGLKKLAIEYGLTNVLFFDEIDPDEIPDLYSQCSIGIVSLDQRHKSHNIPGKFLTYMQSGLPVLANVNPGNDLITIIKDEAVGQVTSTRSADELAELAKKLLTDIELESGIDKRCKNLFEREFAAESAVKQIITAFT